MSDVERHLWDLARIVEHSGDFVGFADLEGRVLHVNPAGQRMVGLRGDDHARHTTIRDYFGPEDRVHVEEVLLPVIRGEGRLSCERLGDVELRLRHFATGELIPVFLDAFRIDDPQTGEATGLATIIRDLRGRRRAAEALRDLAGAITQAECMRADSEDEPARAALADLVVALARVGEGMRAAIHDLRLDRPDDDPAERVRLLLVEDHAVVREAIAMAFEREEGFEVVAQAGSLAEARRVLGDVDVALIDLGLPDGDGAELIAELHVASPKSQALVLSSSLDRAEVARAVQAGAAAALDKTVPLDSVVGAVRRLRAGETLMPSSEVVDLLRHDQRRLEHEREDRRRLEQLTSREREVLQALAEGLNSQQVAARLRISVRTQRNHVSNILAKLGVHSQLQALVLALRYGVVEVR